MTTVRNGMHVDDSVMLQADCLLFLDRQLDALKSALAEQSRTVQLWINYVGHGSDNGQKNRKLVTPLAHLGTHVASVRSNRTW